MITPMSRSAGCTVDKYVGSDFDKVANVSDNMDAVIAVDKVAGKLQDVIDNIEAITDATTHIEAIVNVSDHMEAIEDVHAHMDDVEAVSDNMETITTIANNMESYQIADRIRLVAGQTKVVFPRVIPYACTIHVTGPMVTTTELTTNDFSYESLTGNTLNLYRSYPTGTTIKAVQTVYKSDAPITVISEFGAFNRKVVYHATGAIYNWYSEEGEVRWPRLLVGHKQYVPEFPDTTAGAWVIMSTDIQYTPNSGQILVFTNQGWKAFNAIMAEAVTWQEFHVANTRIKVIEDFLKSKYPDEFPPTGFVIPGVRNIDVGVAR